MQHKIMLGTLAIVFASLPPTLAQRAKKKRLVIDDPTKVNSDFHVQGEYEGRLDLDGLTKNFGLQVVAKGDGRFEAYGHWGGLPGAGWDKSGKLELEGTTRGPVTTLSRAKGEKKGAVVIDKATIAFGQLTVWGSDGGALGKLEQVFRRSPTLGAKPPPGAVVLFDGSSSGNFENGRRTPSGLLMQGTSSKQKVQSCKLHIEFRVPFMPFASGQGRGNSGCYLQGRYEVQILDSFGLRGRRNECGGIYSVSDPAVNMCFPPLSWQSYDVDFTAATFDSQGKKLTNPRMTVRHNGVLVHDEVEITRGETTAAPREEGPDPGPVYLQAHGGNVRYRNIWLVPKG